MPILSRVSESSSTLKSQNPLIAFRRWLPVMLLLLFCFPDCPAQTPGPPSPPDTLPDASCQQAIDHGISAFKSGHYDAAARHFQAAVSLDPTSSQAHLYLGTTYAEQVIPALDTPENLVMAKNAMDNLNRVPREDPAYLIAQKQIASTYRNINRLDEARSTERDILRLAPEDAEAHYIVGVLDWTEAYKNTLQALASQHLYDNGDGNPELNPNSCLELQAKNGTLVEDGLNHLIRSIELNPRYADAMAYLNLTYRRRADLACGDRVKIQRDLAEANRWIAKSMEARHLNETNTPPKP